MLSTKELRAFKSESATLRKSGAHDAVAVVADAACRVARIDDQGTGRHQRVIVDVAVVGDDKRGIVATGDNVLPGHALAPGERGVFTLPVEITGMKGS